MSWNKGNNRNNMHGTTIKILVLSFKSWCFNIKNLCILPAQCIHVSYDSHNKNSLRKILCSYSSINHKSNLSRCYILSVGKQLLTVWRRIVLLRSFNHEDKGTILLWNISNYLIKTRHNNIPEDFTRSNVVNYYQSWHLYSQNLQI
jgi:hypothetical protein